MGRRQRHRSTAHRRCAGCLQLGCSKKAGFQPDRPTAAVLRGETAGGPGEAGQARAWDPAADASAAGPHRGRPDRSGTGTAPGSDPGGTPAGAHRTEQA